MDSALLKTILLRNHAELSQNVADYKAKMARAECRQVVDITSACEYHYTCIRANLRQIEYHLQEIENQCAQLEPRATVPTTPKHNSFIQERVRLFSAGSASTSRILTPSMLQTFDDFYVVEASLQRPSNLANKLQKPAAANRSQSDDQPCDETML